MNKIGNVSFGRLVVNQDIAFRTEKQRQVEDEVRKAFDEFNEDYYNRGDIVDDNYKPITLASALFCGASSDVYVTHKKDQTVEIALKENHSQYGEPEVKTDKYNHPLTLVLNSKKSLKVLKGQLRRFTNRCLSYAQSGSENNFLNDEKLRALDALREEERFVREFGTDIFN